MMSSAISLSPNAPNGLIVFDFWLSVLNFRLLLPSCILLVWHLLAWIAGVCLLRPWSSQLLLLCKVSRDVEVKFREPVLLACGRRGLSSWILHGLRIRGDISVVYCSRSLPDFESIRAPSSWWFLLASLIPCCVLWLLVVVIFSTRWCVWLSLPAIFAGLATVSTYLADKLSVLGLFHLSVLLSVSGLYCSVSRVSGLLSTFCLSVVHFVTVTAFLLETSIEFGWCLLVLVLVRFFIFFSSLFRD